MIRYDLICDQEHGFDGWFKDSAGFVAQASAGDIACPICGSIAIEKALMAPNVATSKKRAAYAKQGSGSKELRDAIRKLRKHVESNADYVGDNFAEEARKIHYKETEERGIYGEASADEIGELKEEGIEACPLPVLPEDKN